MTKPVRFRVSGPRPRIRGRRVFAILLGAAILIGAPILARAQGAGADSVHLAWSAPGDDGSLGTATLYDLRFYAQPITAGNWDSTTPVTGLPAPRVSGTKQTFTVRSLTRGTTYYFAIRTRDDAGNWSAISNVLRWDWIVDTAPPAAPGGVSAARAGSGAHVHWTANTEPDLAGYTVSRATTAQGPYTPLNGTLVTSTDYVDNSIPAGTGVVWYAVTASDQTGNVSARSAAVSLSLVADGSVWTVDPGYPNPSRAGSPVTVPVVIPASGATSGTLDITDDGGHRIRQIPISSLGPGRQNVTWDGRNDAGREVAPGVYRAWLVAGNTRQAIRLVRVP